jgi:hypothetical protein
MVRGASSGDMDVVSVALRGPRACSVYKIPGLTPSRQPNGETPNSDATTVSNVRVISIDMAPNGCRFHLAKTVAQSANVSIIS